EVEEESAPLRSRRPRFGRRSRRAVIEDDDEEEDEEDEDEEEPKSSGRQGRSRSSTQEKESWQSKDFLELDDDMEFEFLDL
ncbi:MAG: hypothetical protein IJP31_03885, partial [Lachnospiraceae bacterium]|nr:hypothetical protein [Lachnospiraceae bacterium]